MHNVAIDSRLMFAPCPRVALTGLGLHVVLCFVCVLSAMGAFCCGRSSAPSFASGPFYVSPTEDENEGNTLFNIYSPAMFNIIRAANVFIHSPLGRELLQKFATEISRAASPSGHPLSPQVINELLENLVHRHFDPAHPTKRRIRSRLFIADPNKKVVGKPWEFRMPSFMACSRTTEAPNGRDYFQWVTGLERSVRAHLHRLATQLAAFNALYFCLTLDFCVLVLCC